jgi:hypothetical protein
VQKHSTEQHPDDRNSLVIATRELIIANISVLVARRQFDEALWWPLEHAEQICQSHCSWSSAPLPADDVARELRFSATHLYLNLDL